MEPLIQGQGRHPITVSRERQIIVRCRAQVKQFSVRLIPMFGVLAGASLLAQLNASSLPRSWPPASARRFRRSSLAPGTPLHEADPVELMGGRGERGLGIRAGRCGSSPGQWRGSDLPVALSTLEVLLTIVGKVFVHYPIE
jgi:hypothetical protein